MPDTAITAPLDGPRALDVLTQLDEQLGPTDPDARALQGVATTMLDDHVRHCVRDAIRSGPEQADEKVEEALDVIHRLIKR